MRTRTPLPKSSTTTRGMTGFASIEAVGIVSSVAITGTASLPVQQTTQLTAQALEQMGFAVVLYAALLMLVPVWAWRGEWLDAWDAALWLAAFFAIELNVLGYAAQS